MNFKKMLGIGGFALLASCAPPQKLPDFPEMSFEEKITYHTSDGELSYFEAKDLVNAYEKEEKGEISTDGERLSVQELRYGFKEKLNEDFLLLNTNEYYEMYNPKEKLSEEYTAVMKNLVFCLKELSTNAKNKEIFEKLSMKNEYNLEEALFVYSWSRSSNQVFYIKDEENINKDVNKFKEFFDILNKYCTDISMDDVRYETPYVSLGVLGALIHSTEVDPESSSKSLEQKIQEMTGNQVKVPENKSLYPKTYFGVWWGLLVGIIAPLVMKLLVTSYTRREKTEKLDEIETSASAIIGNIGLDVVHPYIFWARLFAPIAVEIIMDAKRR